MSASKRLYMKDWHRPADRRYHEERQMKEYYEQERQRKPRDNERKN